MQPKSQIIAPHKMMMLVGVVCALIIASLFLFHLRGKTTHIVLPEDVGMLFPVPRDIKSFELVSTAQQSFTEKDFYHHWTLLFFGFTHCQTVCPVTLEMINHAYPELIKAAPTVKVVLVSLDPERDSLNTLQQYTQSFNPQFIGVTGKIQNIRKLQSELGIFSARETSTSNNYQIQHTASIMLINPQGKWAGFFKFGISPNQLSHAFKQSIRGT